jgi:hypothetical protein
MSAILVHPSHFPEWLQASNRLQFRDLRPALPQNSNNWTFHEVVRGGTMDVMTTIGRIAATATALLSALSAAGAVELKVSREALQRTLQQRLFNAPNGRYYLKGSATSGCRPPLFR